MQSNVPSTRNSILGGIALVALLIYVLACTSFSPDDRQVLFPAFDVRHGGLNAMVYDLKTKKMESLYVAVNPRIAGQTNRVAGCLRPEWFPDGEHILVARQNDDEHLELSVVPWGVREPVRFFRLPKSEVGDGTLMMPLPIIGSEVFIRGKDKSVIALNFMTGTTRFATFTNQIGLYGDPDGKTLFGWEESSGTNSEEAKFGRIDLDTLTFRPLMKIPIQKMSDGGTFAFSADGNRMCLLGGFDGRTNMELRVFSGGKIEFSRRIEAEAGEIAFNPAASLSPNGDLLCTTFVRADSGWTNCEYGLLEAPLNSSPVRWTTLLRAAKGDDADTLYFQGGLSHDGRTWAICSAYLWGHNPHVGDEDAALFLVDLRDPKRKITKIPIPVPQLGIRPLKD